MTTNSEIRGMLWFESEICIKGSCFEWLVPSWWHCFIRLGNRGRQDLVGGNRPLQVCPWSTDSAQPSSLPWLLLFLLQRSASKLLEPLGEVDFPSSSYGQLSRDGIPWDSPPPVLTCPLILPCSGLVYVAISRRDWFTANILIFCVLYSFHPLFHDVLWVIDAGAVPLISVLLGREASLMRGGS